MEEVSELHPVNRIRLKHIDPGCKDRHEDREQAIEEISRYQGRLSELQSLLYAERRHLLLICLQAMDTGGKDGTINNVLKAMNPQGAKWCPFVSSVRKRWHMTSTGGFIGLRPNEERLRFSIALITRTC